MGAWVPRGVYVTTSEAGRSGRATLGGVARDVGGGRLTTPYACASGALRGPPLRVVVVNQGRRTDGHPGRRTDGHQGRRTDGHQGRRRGDHKGRPLLGDGEGLGVDQHVGGEAAAELLIGG